MSDGGDVGPPTPFDEAGNTGYEAGNVGYGTGDAGHGPGSAAVAHAGDWVQVHAVVLRPGERAAGIPPETAAAPLEVRIKGFLVDPAAQVGRPVTIRTKANHEIQGTLEAVMPAFQHHFGQPVPELLPVGSELRRILAES